MAIKRISQLASQNRIDINIDLRYILGQRNREVGAERSRRGNPRPRVPKDCTLDRPVLFAGESENEFEPFNFRVSDLQERPENQPKNIDKEVIRKVKKQIQTIHGQFSKLETDIDEQKRSLQQV